MVSKVKSHTKSSWRLEGKDADKFRREMVDYATNTLNLTSGGVEEFANIFIQATRIVDKEFETEDD